MDNYLIVGANGQDGKILKYQLNNENLNVICIYRDSAYFNKTFLSNFSIISPDQVSQIIKTYKPKEVYYFASHNQSSEQSKSINEISETKLYEEANEIGLRNFLDAIYRESPKTKLFYASTSLIFDGSNGNKQNELTPVNPTEIYAQTKLNGQLLCKNYREDLGIFAASGILYNHESKFRQPHFFSKKLIIGAHNISKKTQDYLEVGNLDVRVDWGYAPDFVDAFRRILSLENPDDYIVATGEANSAKDFSRIVFNYFGLNFTEHLVENPTVISRRLSERVGDYSKLHNATRWSPTKSFENMIEKLVEDYLESPYATT
jgi:GDPmannose 4,6-dehydratase